MALFTVCVEVGLGWSSAPLCGPMPELDIIEMRSDSIGEANGSTVKPLIIIPDARPAGKEEEKTRASDVISRVCSDTCPPRGLCYCVLFLNRSLSVMDTN